MKKTLIGLLVGLALVSGLIPSGAVLAVEGTASVDNNSAISKITELMKQISELQEKVTKLKSEQGVSSPGFGVGVAVKEQWSEDSDYKFEKNLSFGVRNDKDVERLQNFLLEKGYYSGPVTGNYLSLTLKAVKKFQKDNGVEDTGYLGPKTRAVIKDKVVSCTVGQDCGTTIIKPAEHVLKITTDSSLTASVGKDFSAIFKVNGWNPSHGDLNVEGSGVIPGLSWSKPTIQCIMAPCGDAPMKNSQTIYLNGTPTQAGVYQVTVTASSWSSGCNSTSGICPEMAKQTGYGKAEFTIVVNNSSGTNLPPVITGLKGPTSLKVGEEGQWEIKAHDPDSSILSYSVVWGDEVENSAQSAAKTATDSTSQKASFSHVYSRAGEYKAVFTVTDETGLKAAASLTTVVGGGVVQAGTLMIDPSSANFNVGDGGKFVASFTPMGNCDGIHCPKPASRLVEASWSVSVPGIVTLRPNPCPLNQNCEPYVYVSASVPGKVYLIASYTESGNTYLTKVPIVVQAIPPTIEASLKIDPSSASLKVGEGKQFVAWFDPAANCDGKKCPKLPVRQVEASWSVSAPGVAVIKPNVCPNLPNTGACLPQVTVEGVAAGRVNLIATYENAGRVYTANAVISVSSVPTPRGTLLIEPSSLSLQKGQSGTLSSFFVPYVPPCSSNTESPCLAAVKSPVDVLWSNSTPGRISLSCFYATTNMSQDKLWQQCSGSQVSVGALAGGGSQVLASYKDANGQAYTVATPITVTDPNPVMGKLVIVPSSLSLEVGSSKIMSLFMQDPMPPCPAGMACIQVMPPCTGTTMNATGASQGTAKVSANYVDGTGQYYLAESLVTVSGVGTSSSTAASFSASQQTANVLQYLYETLLGMQSGLSR